jgi:hypothetical protein
MLQGSSSFAVRPIGSVHSPVSEFDSASQAVVPAWVAELMRGYF